MSLKVYALGQTGYIFNFDEFKVIIDPYLSEYVAIKYGNHLKKMISNPIDPSNIKDINVILLTHAHEDHCDPFTLKPLLKGNKSAKVFGTYECLKVFKEFGLPTESFQVSDELNFSSSKVFIESIVSAHPRIEYSDNYSSMYLGYIMRFEDLIIYHPGDTIPHKKINESLPQSIDWAFLPINERNYFREREGIIGNMTPREALTWCDELNVRHLVPTHWDTFKPNSTYQEEIEFLYKKGNFNFDIHWITAGEQIELTKVK
jgi:L-ascorbate metabolism protein UlaG (beta-lactamase superfamily)